MRTDTHKYRTRYRIFDLFLSSPRAWLLHFEQSICNNVEHWFGPTGAGVVIYGSNEGDSPRDEGTPRGC